MSARLGTGFLVTWSESSLTLSYLGPPPNWINSWIRPKVFFTLLNGNMMERLPGVEEGKEAYISYAENILCQLSCLHLWLQTYHTSVNREQEIGFTQPVFYPSLKHCIDNILMAVVSDLLGAMWYKSTCWYLASFSVHVIDTKEATTPQHLFMHHFGPASHHNLVFYPVWPSWFAYFENSLTVMIVEFGKREEINKYRCLNCRI